MLSTGISTLSTFACLVALIVYSCKESSDKEAKLLNKIQYFAGQPEVIKPEVKTEVEKTFWDMHFQNGKLHNLFEMAQNSAKDNPEKSAAFIIDNYIQFRQQEDKTFSLTETENKGLIDSVTSYLKRLLTPSWSLFPFFSDKVELPDGNTLHKLTTKGDGSCALHALLGEKKFWGTYETDAKAARSHFCEWLRKKFQANDLPASINIVLEDAFDNFERAGFVFRQAVEESYKKYHDGYDQLPPNEKKKRLEGFVHDKEVFEIYLSTLMRTDVHLLHLEFLAAAQCFGKTVVLYQPGQFFDSNNIRLMVLNNFGAPTDKANIKQEDEVQAVERNLAEKDIIRVWYNGHNHYQRAEKLIVKK